MKTLMILNMKTIEQKKKMDGKTTKYYYYDSNKQSIVTIPISMAKGLNWGHQDEINILIEVVNGQKGLFLFKKEHTKTD